MFVRFLFVFDLLFNLFRTALWPSVGKELSPWLFTCAVISNNGLLVRAIADIVFYTDLIGTMVEIN